MKNLNNQSLSGLSETDLVNLVEKLNWPSYKGKQLHSWIYKKWVSSFDEMTDLNLKDRQILKENYNLSPLKLVERKVSEDKTIKYLWKLSDNKLVESVRIPLEIRDQRSDVIARSHKVATKQSHKSYDPSKIASVAPLPRNDKALTSYSACISSQIGCAVGCPFCATGTLGLTRNLNAAEIVDQVLGIQRDTKERINNIVFMGQGEPLHNYSEVIKSIHLIRESVGIGTRHITISTSGVVPNIIKLADEKLQITLAVSLHTPYQKTREILVPIAKRYKIDELMKSLYYYYEKTKRRITFEYVMLDEVNDQIEAAKELADLIKNLHCHVNLIPYNPIEHEPANRRTSDGAIGQLKRPMMSKIYRFKEILENNSKKKVTIRHPRGVDISAACGQLANKTVS